MNLSSALSTLANGGASRKLKTRRMSLANAVAACVADVTPLPAADDVHFLIMDQKWAMADLIPVCHEFGGTIDALTVFTLGWSRQTVADMGRAKETGLLRHARVVASHFFRRTEKSVFNATFPLLDAAGIPFVCVNSHIKAAAFRFDSGKFATFCGSGNWRSCCSLENLTGTGAPAAFYLFDGLADAIFANPAAFSK